MILRIVNSKLDFDRLVKQHGENFTMVSSKCTNKFLCFTPPKSLKNVEFVYIKKIFFDLEPGKVKA